MTEVFSDEDDYDYDVNFQLNSDSLSTDIKKRVSVIGNRLKENKKIQRIIESTKKKIKEEPFLKLTDKLIFTFSVLIATFTQYLMILFPRYIYILYTVICIPLLINRSLSPRANKN
eukprot:TRINITY_DN8244_c0_g2_i1.p1 TRINITY_DN8244_c0_g2~~TRINITY_DN8244_c0_g2_i1.p1  ORF type:complete len:116 (+),score=16.12 TRINITY_DN8244_c0_g2_i1:31-378(+)